MTVTLELNGQRVTLHDHAAKALGHLAASRGTADAMTLADQLLFHSERGAVTLNVPQQLALMSVAAEAPPDSAKPELRDEITELRKTLEAIFDPE